jgi:hypothetical protein
MGEECSIHDLALEDCPHAQQRPKLDDPEHVLLVADGAKFDQQTNRATASSRRWT